MEADPIIVETVLNRSYMLPFYFPRRRPSVSNTAGHLAVRRYLGYETVFYLTHNFEPARYYLLLKEIEIDQLRSPVNKSD